MSHAQRTVIHAEVLDSRRLALGETTGEKQGYHSHVPDMLARTPAHEQRRAELRALLIPVFPCSQSSVASLGKAFISASIGKHLDCCVTMWRGPACHDVGNPYTPWRCVWFLRRCKVVVVLRVPINDRQFAVDILYPISGKGVTCPLLALAGY